MLTRLNSVEILEGARHHLENSVLPQVQGDTAVVLTQIIGDLMGVVQRRIENEPQWLTEEIDIMLGLLSRARNDLAVLEIPEAQDAVRAIDAVANAPEPERYEAVSIAYIERRYSDVAQAVSKTLRALGFAPDEQAVEPLVKELQRYMLLRSDRELVIAGNDPPRGRG
jgi:hypothetical protein